MQIVVHWFEDPKAKVPAGAAKQADDSVPVRTARVRARRADDDALVPLFHKTHLDLGGWSSRKRPNSVWSRAS
jgi:hypothetical protein